MPSYKFTYFNVRARGETARMLFKLADQEFEDIKVGDNWPQLKKTLPMGQVPVLDVDGTMLCQSNTINRYLAREFGFAGKDSLETAKIEMVADSVEDGAVPIGPFYSLQGDELNAYVVKFRNDTLLPYLARIEKLLESNNGGDGFFVGDQVTWADLLCVNLMDYIFVKSQNVGLLEKYPKLAAHKARVESNPKIAAWIKERPETPM